VGRKAAVGLCREQLYRTAQGFSAPWKGRVDPVGGRYPTRQLLLQPEAVGAWRAGNGTGTKPLRSEVRQAGSASKQPLRSPEHDKLTTIAPLRHSKKPVIAFAGGKYKWEAVRAALRGKWINGLVTDESCALAIAESENLTIPLE
jgi:Putative sugar-binding domain